MKVVSPEFNKKKTPEEQVKELVSEHIPKLLEEDEFTQAVFIAANEQSMQFLTNLDVPQLNLLMDVAKQYVLLGE
jgi:hypothetical protein